MKTKFMAAVLAVAVAVATPAMAGTDMTRPVSGYVYYNRPGADMATHNAELTACAKTANKATQPVDMRLSMMSGMVGGGVLGAAIAGGLGAALSESSGAFQTNSAFVTNLENCMVVRGWRVVQLDEAAGKRLFAMEQAELARELAPLVGAEEPQGEIARVWRNDLTRPDVRIFTFAGDLDKTPLSLKGWSAPEQPVPDEPEFPAPPPGMRLKIVKSALPPQGVAAAKIGEVPADSAVIVVRITGPNLHRGQRLEFVRYAPEEGFPADGVIRRPGAFAPTLKGGLVNAVGKPLDTIAAFVVPAGHWRLNSLGEESHNVGLCLGAPGLDVKPGEVLFAGTFDLNAEHVGPDLSLAPAEAFLRSRPDLVERLRPAAYTNGETFPCRGQWLYALEVKDAPFKPGYTWGGATAPAAQPGGATP